MSTFRLAIGAIALFVALGLAACSGGKDGRSSGSPLAPTSSFSTSASINGVAGNSEGRDVGSQLEHDADDLSDAPSDDATSDDDSSSDDDSVDGAVNQEISLNDADSDDASDADSDDDDDSSSDDDSDSDSDSDDDSSGTP